MKKLVIIPLIMLFTALAFAQSAPLQFSNGWIKQLPPVIPMRAGYVTISNPGEHLIKIVSMHSDAFEKVEMHESKMADGVMKMVELDSLDIPPKGQIELKPGAKHLMLIAPTREMKIGDKIAIQANLDDGATQTLLLEVKP